MLFGAQSVRSFTPSPSESTAPGIEYVKNCERIGVVADGDTLYDT